MFNEQELRVAMVREQKTMKDIADMLEISQTTLYRKIKRDGDFSRKEIQRISEFLKLKFFLHNTYGNARKIERKI